MEYSEQLKQHEQHEALACNVTVERYRQLIALYRAGKYQFEPPPVYSGNWGQNAWIRYIQLGGGLWLEPADSP